MDKIYLKAEKHPAALTYFVLCENTSGKFSVHCVSALQCLLWRNSEQKIWRDGFRFP